MLPLRPVGISWTMATVHPTLDVYRIFRGEPIHDVSHGIALLIEDCLVNMLRDEHQTTSALETWKAETGTFESVPKTVLLACSEFIRDVEHLFVRNWLHVDFAKGNSLDMLSEFFNETGIVGILEAKDYDKIDLVSPFIGAIIDQLCRRCEWFTKFIGCSLCCDVATSVSLWETTGPIFGGLANALQSDQRVQRVNVRGFCKVPMLKNIFLNKC